MSTSDLVFRPSLLRVVSVVAVGGLAITVAWYLATSALVAQDIIPPALVAATFVTAAVAVASTLWFVPKLIRPIRVGDGRARVPGPLFRTTVITSEDVEYIWVKIPKEGSSEGFTPLLRMNSGKDITLDLLAGPTEHGVLLNCAKFARALGVKRPVGSTASRP